MIRLQEIEIGYQNKLLQADITLELGALYALIGSNGSGKTTFLKSISGTIPLLSGTVYIGDDKLENLSLKQKALKLAFVETRFPEVNFMSGYEFVSLGRTPHTNAFGIIKNEDEKIIHKIFEFLEISFLKSKFTSQMSDGEKQMILIAKALVQETDVILLDEPMAFLDYANKRSIINKLIQISREMKKCIVFSSHDIELCLEFKTTILLVSKLTRQITLEKNINKESILAKSF